MMLLALLSVGLLTIASSQVRIAEKQLFAAEAKSLARFSLEVALGPVSYTHLDVYKRQGLMKPRPTPPLPASSVFLRMNMNWPTH